MQIMFCYRFYGYEVATEGDAFILAFHEPVDAVAWCLCTQHALLAAQWPETLLTHPAAGIRLRPDLEGRQAVNMHSEHRRICPSAGSAAMMLAGAFVALLRFGNFRACRCSCGS